MKFQLSAVVLMIAAVVIVSIIQLSVPFQVSPTVIRGDGVGYYAWLRSVLIDQDVDFQNEFEHYEALLSESARPMSSRLLEGPRTPTGLVPNHWPVGPAVMWLPFVLVAHAVAAVSGSAADGYGPPYQIAIALGSATYALIGLWLLYRVLRRYFDVEASMLSVLTVWGGSSLTAYMYYIPSMSHACSFFAVSLIIYIWTRLRDNPTPIQFFWLAAACGLAFITRLQDILFGIVLGIEWLRASRRSERGLVTAATLLCVIALGGMLASLPQLLAWQMLNGIPLPGDYAGSSFDWSAPHLMDVLFAPRYGLLTSTPMFALGLAGLLWLWRRDRPLVVVLGFVFLGQLWLIASFSYYHSGAAFGPRYFVSVLPFAALGLAATYDRLASGFGCWIPRLLMVALVAWNYLLLALYGLSLIPRGGTMSWEVFWEGVVRLMRRLKV